MNMCSPEWAAKCEAFLAELTELSRKHGVVIERAWGGELNLEPMAGSRREGGYVWTFADGFGCWEKR